VTNRWKRRPNPGQPSAKVVKSRCKGASLGRVGYLQQPENPRIPGAAALISGDQISMIPRLIPIVTA
jgi:hypothetical protein